MTVGYQTVPVTGQCQLVTPLGVPPRYVWSKVSVFNALWELFSRKVLVFQYFRI